MTTSSTDLSKATDYSFREADIERAKLLAGQYTASRTREFLTAATHDAMRNFARSYGDDNPLFTSEDYGDATRWDTQIGAPMMPLVLNRPLYDEPPTVKVKRPSFRGIHVFFSGSSWDWYRPVSVGDELYSFEGFESVQEKTTEFAERSLFITTASVKFNQRAEVVAVSRTLAVYTERKTTRKKGKYAGIEPARYTDEDLEKLDAIYAAEERRGAEPRFWEDVEVGESLPPKAKGPLTTTDMIVFHAGGFGFAPYEPCTNRLAYQNRQRIAPFYVKNEFGIPDVAQRVHWDSLWAQAIGNPMAYDYAAMRECHLSHLVTDWMGNDGWLVHQRSEMRKFNYIGDSHIITGEIVGKRIEDGRCLVDIELRGTNQRDVVTCPATAVVALPSREHGPVSLPEPPSELSEEAAERMQRHQRLVGERKAEAKK